MSSGQFIADDKLLSQFRYWVGNDKCGWNGCDLNVLTQISREKSQPIAVDFFNCAIKNPFKLESGDIIRFCGTATCDGADNGDEFATAVEQIDCEGYADGEFEADELFSDTYYFTDKFVCWSREWTVDQNIDACKRAFVLGFAGDTTDRVIKITWTFSVIRPAVQN
jgi:hypothetical protein